VSEVERIRTFLDQIGLSVFARDLPGPTLLPGLTIDGGAVIYDPARLTFPGDLLHEAGHVAFAPSSERGQLSCATHFTLGDDLAAIAWSWAALTHLDLDPTLVFHEGGYDGWSSAYIENFSAGRYVGVSLLEWADMTFEPKHGQTGEPLFPQMLKWMRD
jgi:hypothetical protein